ncbi:MAG: hypothetical protein EHM58_12295 [Ignavibacteriae bacterium]|nr:MAG: hypothetical protein EHM58_12295 [Ignavibacteriota bacterium]
MKEPISYLDKEMDDVLSSDRNNYNELIVAPDEIFGFFIKQYPTNEIIDKGEAPEWMTKDLVLKEMYYTKKDVSTFCKNNQLPLIRISDDNFYLVTDIFKKTEEVLNWQSFKNRLLSNNL